MEMAFMFVQQRSSVSKALFNMAGCCWLRSCSFVFYTDFFNDWKEKVLTELNLVLDIMWENLTIVVWLTNNPHTKTQVAIQMQTLPSLIPVFFLRDSWVI